MGKGSTTHQLQKFEALGYSPLHQLSSSLGVERSGRGEQGPPARLVCRKGKSTPTSLASKPEQTFIDMFRTKYLADTTISHRTC